MKFVTRAATLAGPGLATALSRAAALPEEC